MSDEEYIPMKSVSYEDYQAFLQDTQELVFRDRIGKREWAIQIGSPRTIPEGSFQPKQFQLEGTTVWSFPRRGKWASHSGDFRGNWPPQLARNLILRYTVPQDLVLDQMCGSGTTLIECKLLHRNGIGVDINPRCVMLTWDRLCFEAPPAAVEETQGIDVTQRTFVGDARHLNKIQDEIVDLIATHPPYANIIPYSQETVRGDLSRTHSLQEYVVAMGMVAAESYRVLKPGKYCALLVGDTRRHKHYVPIAYRVMEAFLAAGFLLKEDVIKHQWRCKATPFWLKRSVDYNFLLLMHEHLFVFRKPERGERLHRFRDSMTSTLREG